MAYGFKEFAVNVLAAVNRPLGSMDIWTEGKRLGLDKELTTQGKTPWNSIGAQIYVEIRNNPTTRFKQVSKRPALFALAEQNFSRQDIAETVQDNETAAEPHYHERCLHPALVKYLFANAHFRCLTKTIYHETSKKTSKKADMWIHPDLIGVYFPFDDYEELTLKTLPLLNEKLYKIFSFEMKKTINLANLRECYFQAVSNASWSHEGYLVAPNISEDDNFLSELSLLNNAFGIGVIRLNIEFPEQSEILFYSRQKPNIDSNMLDKLIARNKDVQSIFKNLLDSNSLSRIIDKNKFDKVLDEDEYMQYAIANHMLSTPA